MKLFDVNGDKLTRTELEKCLIKRLTILNVGEAFLIIIKRIG